MMHFFFFFIIDSDGGVFYGIAMMPDADMELPYEGANEMILVDAPVLEEDCGR